MKKIDLDLSNEKGALLIISILMLALLSIIGISSTNTSTIELIISQNERNHKMAFYNAEAGIKAATELLKQNIDEGGWDDGDEKEEFEVVNGDFALNTAPVIPSDINRDAFFPKRYPDGATHTNLTFSRASSISTGNAIQASSGYKGKGYGLAGGGADIIYQIQSQRMGINNSKALIKIKWRDKD